MIRALERQVAPVVLAVLVHLLALGGLLYQWSNEEDSTHLLRDQPMVQAKLVAMRPSSPSRRPAAPRLREPERRKDNLPVPDLLKPREPTPTPALIKPTAANKPTTAREQRQLEQKAIDDALKAEAAALAADSSAEAVQSYSDRMGQLVIQAWSRPPSARNGMRALLLIELVPTGEVVRVQLVRGSGDEAFDRSAVDAVHAVARFEVPKEPKIFDRNFRRFQFMFKPEDLLR